MLPLIDFGSVIEQLWKFRRHMLADRKCDFPALFHTSSHLSLCRRIERDHDGVFSDHQTRSRSFSISRLFGGHRSPFAARKIDLRKSYHGNGLYTRVVLEI